MDYSDEQLFNFNNKKNLRHINKLKNQTNVKNSHFKKMNFIQSEI